MTALLCVLVPLVAGVALAFQVRRWVLAPAQLPTTGVFASGPTLSDVQRHRPLDEATLRQLDLGPDVERIVRLYHAGRLSPGLVLEHLSVESRVDEATTSSVLHQRYAWRDAEGRVHERRTDDPTSGLLNRTFEPRHREDPFLVAWDPYSRDHVVFYAQGGVRRAGAAAPRPPHRPMSRPPEAMTAAGLEASLPDALGDDAALAVLADRLVELGDPRGTLVSMQLRQPAGAPPSPEALALIWANWRAWVPPGVATMNWRFERGVLAEATWAEATNANHPAWSTVKVLAVEAPSNLDDGASPFAGALPALEEVRALSAAVLGRLPERHSRRLRTLGLSFRSDEAPFAALERLRSFPALERVVLERPAMLAAPVEAVVRAVDAWRGPALTELWLPEQPVHLPTVQAQLRTMSRPLSVHFVFGLPPARARAFGTAWVSVQASGLTLHTRGADPVFVSRAQQVMVNAGVARPTVVLEP